MIVDFETEPRGAFEDHFDICIIGSGPAGMTLARKLAAHGARVALMEGGGETYENRSQEIYKGEDRNGNYWYLEFPRLRQLGGSSMHWAGWCRAMDEVDFRPPADAPWDGWPFPKSELSEFVDETESILELPPPGALPPLVQTERRFERFEIRYSPPVRFADTYLEELAESSNIRLALHANLVDLGLSGDGRRIETATFKSYRADDPGLTITAERFCLCTGGIENARLLLNFRSDHAPDGIGNRFGRVGRTFCEHPHFVVADALLTELGEGLEFFRPTPALIAERQILNFGLRLEPSFLNPPGAPDRAEIEGCAADLTSSLAKAAGSGSTLAAPGGLLERIVAGGCQTATIRTAHAQDLNPDSRILLAEERDRFGLQRTALDWRLTDLDFRTMREAGTAFGLHLAEQGLGRLRLRSWLLDDEPTPPDVLADEVGGKHHMCSTRMDDDPRNGVVDADCRVHGMDNLYIGGSSVFATPGQSNPTYTIVQLTLRLAKHLATRL